MSNDVVVYGASGHTGAFISGELRARGMAAVLAGRDRARLLAAAGPLAQVRAAAVNEPDALARAFEGAGVVINAAGPFLDTGVPVATAALRAGAHYVDVSAEQAAVAAILALGDDVVGDRLAVPGLAFFGGLADLLATAATAGWGAVNEVTVAMGIDRWWPTQGTLATGERNTVPRVVVAGGRLVPAPSDGSARTWDFPAPLGRNELVPVPLSEMVLMADHLDVTNVTTLLSTSALQDLGDPRTGAPVATDGSGRSDQRFCVEVVARGGDQEARRRVSGRDIYAVTAPLVVEAAARLLDGRTLVHRGAAAPGAVFDAADFLDSLRAHLDPR